MRCAGRVLKVGDRERRLKCLPGVVGGATDPGAGRSYHIDHVLVEKGDDGLADNSGLREFDNNQLIF